MARPLKRMAPSLLIACLLLSRAALAASPEFTIDGRGGEFEGTGDNPKPDLNPGKSEKRMWVVAIHSSAPNELTQAVTGTKGANCPGKPITLHANITPAAGRKIAYAWMLNGQRQ